MQVSRNKITYFPLFPAAVFVHQQCKRLCVDYSCHQHTYFEGEKKSTLSCSMEKNWNKTLGASPLPNSIKTVLDKGMPKPARPGCLQPRLRLPQLWGQLREVLGAQVPAIATQPLAVLIAFVRVKSSLKKHLNNHHNLATWILFKCSLQSDLSQQCKPGW